MGYVYVLSNASMPGLVKIGSTDRSPAERAAELSAVTAVPTPFLVESAVYFRDHTTAELTVHQQLVGSRVRDAREFFRASVADACQQVQELHLAHLTAEVAELDSYWRSAFFEILRVGFPDDPTFAAVRYEDSQRIVAELDSMPEEGLASILQAIIAKRPAFWKNFR